MSTGEAQAGAEVTDVLTLQTLPCRADGPGEGQGAATRSCSGKGPMGSPGTRR